MKTVIHITFLSLICSTGFCAGVFRVEPYGLNPIAKAIQHALPGDTLFLAEGRYRESPILINKTIALIGQGKVILDGMNSDEVITVMADGVTIMNLTIVGAGVNYTKENAGIRLKQVQNVLVEGNTFIDNFFGIYLSKSSNCTLRGNKLSSHGHSESSSGNGIHLWSCRRIEIEDNRITGHRDGIYFEFVKDSRVTGNISEHNLRYGLHFMFSDSCAYKENTFRQNLAGVAVMYTKWISMVNNRFERNWGAASYGLLLKDITDSEIEGNVFETNTTGIQMEGCNRVKVINNDLLTNGWAMQMMGNSTLNEVRGNNFIGNSFDVATNTRNNDNVFKQNYWSGYEGYDLDRDSFGDVPYHPVSLFSVVIAQHPESLILLRSFFIEMMSVVERIMPVLTPQRLIDSQPLMKRHL